MNAEPQAPSAAFAKVAHCPPDLDRIAISSCGRWVAASTLEGTIRLWRADDGERLLSLDGSFPEARLAFRPDGGAFAITWYQECVGGEVSCISLPDGARCYTTELDTLAKDAWDLCFSRDGALLAGGYRECDDGVQLWNGATGELLRRLESDFSDAAYSVDFGSDGILAVACGRVDVWRAADGKRLAQLSLPDRRCHAVAFNPRGDMLAALGCPFQYAAARLRSEIQVWEWPALTTVGRWRLDARYPYILRFFGNRQLLVRHQKGLVTREVTTGRVVGRLDAEDVRSADVSGEVIIVGRSAGSIERWMPPRESQSTTVPDDGK